MGWISSRKNRTGVHLAHGAKPGKRSGVLRKITGTAIFNNMEYELLECGHKGRLISSVNTGGMFGIKDAESRRCTQCNKITP